VTDDGRWPSAARLLGGRRAAVLQLAAADRGGVATHVLTLAQHLSPEKYNVRVLCPESGSLRRRLQELCIPADYLPVDAGMDLAGDARFLTQLIGYLRGHRFDLVHAHSTKAGFLGRLAARISQVPLVLYTPHAYRFTRYRVGSLGWIAYLALEWMGGQWGDGTISVSSFEGLLTRKFRLAPKRGQFVVNNGVPVATANRRHRDPTLRRRLGLPGDRPLVLTVGRLTAQKAPLDFIEAAARIAQRNDAAVFVMVGEGDLEHQARTRAAALGIANRVHILQETDEIQALLLEADVFVMTSRYEGLSYAAAEAAACGCPLVVSDIPGLRDLVQDGHTGFVALPGDVVGFGDRVLRLLNDSDLRSRLGAAGSRFVAEHFGLARMIEETERTYDVLLERSRFREIGRA
jgi:glycosyltransferase involved in cell wall biosynthesis